MAILPFSSREETKLRDSLAQYVFEMEYANCCESDSNPDAKLISEYAFGVADTFIAQRNKPKLKLLNFSPNIAAVSKQLADANISDRWLEFQIAPDKFSLEENGEPKLNSQGEPQYKRGRKPTA